MELLKAAACTWPIIGCLVLLLLNPAAAVKCYICGPGSMAPFEPSENSSPHSTNNSAERPCDAFDSSTTKTEFIRDCPSVFQGCITQIEVGVVSRTCETMKIKSCGQLKDAAYCLCNSDLCNNEPISSPTPSPMLQTEVVNPYGDDDEDYYDQREEGSGHDEVNASSATTTLSIDGLYLDSSTISTEASLQNSTADHRFVSTTGITFTDKLGAKTSGASSKFNYSLFFIFVVQHCLWLVLRD